MGVLVRVVELALLLVLAVVSVSLAIAIGRPETGGLEKVTLVALVAACVAAGVGVTSLARRLRERAVQS
jgi:hypothetical protein